MKAKIWKKKTKIQGSKPGICSISSSGGKWKLSNVSDRLRSPRLPKQGE